MNVYTKEDVLVWIHQTIEQGRSDPPSDELCDYIATCDSCKAALVLLLADLLDACLPALDVTLEQCQNDLAAYIDLEHDEGLHTAIREYPHVWWHLWTSSDFAETYRLTKALVQAEQDGDLPPFPLVGIRHA
jgi:hypothetical protein